MEIIDFPAGHPRIIRTEVFRLGLIDISIGLPEATHQAIAQAARLSGDSVETLLARYVARIAEDYF